MHISVKKRHKKSLIRVDKTIKGGRKLVVDYVNFYEWLQEYHKGKSEAIPARSMKQWGTPRYIRHLTNKARREGIPICTCNEGYFFAANPEDVNWTISKLEMQAKEHMEIAEALRSTKGAVID